MVQNKEGVVLNFHVLNILQGFTLTVSVLMEVYLEFKRIQKDP